DGKVRIGQMNWSKKGMEVHDLQISTRQGTFVVPGAAVNFTLASLWQRRLNELLISDPQLEFNPSPEQENPANTSLTFPELPVSIELLTISGGRLDINTATRQLHFHQLNFTGTLQPQSRFSLSAFVGSGEQQPVAIVGMLQFSPQQNLTLERLSWQGQQLLKDPLSLEFSGGELALDGSRVGLSHFDDEQLQNLFRALGQSSPLPANLAFTLTDVRIKVSLDSSSLQLDLQVARGQVAWNTLSSPFSALRVSLAREQQGWEIAGQFTDPAQVSFDFNARINNINNFAGRASINIPDPGALKVVLIGGPALKINGALHMTADFSWADRRLDMTTEVRGSAATSPATAYLVDIGRINGQGKLQLVDGQESFTLNLRHGSQPFVSASGNFQEFSASLNAANLDILKQLLAPDQLPPQMPAASGVKIAGQFSASGSNWEGRINLSTAETLFTGLSLKNLAMQTKFQLAKNQFTFSDITISAGAAYGDVLTARLAGYASAEFSDAGYSLAFEKLSVNDLNYNSADGLTGVGAAAVALQGHINGSWSAGSIALDLNGIIAAREVLAGVFYANLSSYQANFSVHGELNIGTGELTAKLLEINLPKLGKLVANGQFSPDRISSKGRLDLIELSSSYGEQLKPLLHDFQPTLANLDLAGRLALDYQLHWGPSGWLTQGAVTLKDLSAYWQDQQLEMIDGSGTIPFFLGNGIQADTAASVTKYSGNITLGALSVGPATVEQGKLQLTAELNRIAIISPLQLSLAGGHLAIEDVSLSWAKGQPQGSIKIDIAGVNLEPLNRDLGLPIMQGSLSANLGTIRYLDRQLSTTGIASVEVFGGRFQFSNMRYSEPFSSHPVFYTDIDFTDLDLQQATHTFDFGEMNGILDGHVRGLQLFGTTPAAFEAAVATRETGTRNISVKALNNLSILSQGGISAALSRGIYQFIDFYRYRKIAFDCSLVNDTFTLIGTALPGSNRYLVHGGLLPPRIDITTTTPTISFKEMVNRLGRIDRAGSRNKSTDTNSNKGG
ncbi:MAG: hypothetical protein OQK97_06260, partial [Deltaproteobacteria bacterium]|nr:hypothetical protein [Deltaproteobacteria bacterium]